MCVQVITDSPLYILNEVCKEKALMARSLVKIFFKLGSVSWGEGGRGRGVGGRGECVEGRGGVGGRGEDVGRRRERGGCGGLKPLI